MIRLIKNPDEITTRELDDILTIHKELTGRGWISNYYHDLQELKLKIVDELGKTKYLELATENSKVIGFIVFTITENKISLIEVTSSYHGRGIGKSLIRFLQSRYYKLIATIDSLKPEAIKRLLEQTRFKQLSGSGRVQGSTWEWRKKT